MQLLLYYYCLLTLSPFEDHSSLNALLPQLLEDCTLKLRLNSAARRVFLADGMEAHTPEDIPQDADVFISTGEAFVDPLAEIRGRLCGPS